MFKNIFFCYQTKEGPLVRPDGPELKDSSRLCCSGCGEVGHLEHMCRYYNRTHPAVNPLICRYDDIYAPRKTIRNIERNCGNDNIQQSGVITPFDDISIANNLLNYTPNVPNPNNRSIFDRNKDLTEQNAARQFDNIFSRNKDLTLQIQKPVTQEEEFRFINSTTEYFSKAKKQRMIVNPFFKNNAPPQKPETIVPFTNNECTVFNGFEPDISTKPTETAFAVELTSNKVGDLKIFLDKIFAKINACAKLDVTEIWKQLQIEQKIFNRTPSELTHQRIKTLFQQLHIIIFGVHRVARQSRRPINVLKYWQRRIPSLNKDDILLQSALDDVKKSYDFIFGQSRLDVNYPALIKLVKEMEATEEYSNADIDRDYNFFMVNARGTEFKKLHQLYRRVKCKKHIADIRAFKKTFKSFYKNLRYSKIRAREQINR